MWHFSKINELYSSYWKSILVINIAYITSILSEVFLRSTLHSRYAEIFSKTAPIYGKVYYFFMKMDNKKTTTSSRGFEWWRRIAL